MMGNQQGNIYSVSASGPHVSSQGGLTVTDPADQGIQRSKQMKGDRRHTVDGAQIEQAIMSKADENLVRQRDAFYGHLAQKYPEHAAKINGGSNTQSLPRQHVSSQQYPRQQGSSVNDARYATLPTRPGSADIYRRSASSQQSSVPRRAPGPVYESDVDDPGIMSEAETSATGLYRGGRYRASMPVRSPSRPASSVGGLVFLVYGGQTRRALLPNEVSHVDTIKALFVRSFPDKLTMQFLNSPWRKIYVLEQSTQAYHQLQDIRQVHDRCVLHLYEDDSGAPLQPTYAPASQATKVHETNVDDLDTYFSEPEFEAAHRSRNIIGRSSSYHANTDSSRKAHRPGSLPFPSQQPAPSGSTGDSYTPVYDPDGIRSGASTPDPETRNRMARMESQIANLTAWVQSSRSRTASESDRASDGSYTPRSTEVVCSKSEPDQPPGMNVERRLSGISDGSCSTPQPIISPEIQQKISNVHHQTKELRSEYRNLKRIHQAQAETMRDMIHDTFNKIIDMLQQVPGGNDHPVRSLRQKTDIKLSKYSQDVSRLSTELSDLEASIEELREDVINRRCRVNIDEVESMALVLSKITKGLAELKGQFPKVAQDLKTTLSGEVEVVVKQERYLKEEPERLEDTLQKCKKLTGTLFTLKRLASVQDHRPVTVPDLQTAKEPSDLEKKSVLENIQALVPDYEDRQMKIQEAEEARERKKKLVVNKETVKFEKSLEMASKSLKQAESLPKAEVNKEPLIHTNKDGVHVYQGQAVNHDTGKSQDRMDDIMFIDEPDEISMQLDTAPPSAFRRVNSTEANVTIPLSTLAIPKSPVNHLPPTSMSQTVVETLTERKPGKSHISPAHSPTKQSHVVRYTTGTPSRLPAAPPDGAFVRQTGLHVPVSTSPVKQGGRTPVCTSSPAKHQPISPTKQNMVTVHLSTQGEPAPPVRQNLQNKTYTTRVNLVPTREQRVPVQASVAKTQETQRVITHQRTAANRGFCTSIPVTMTTNVVMQRPNPRQPLPYQHNTMQGLYDNTNRGDSQNRTNFSSEVRLLQDLPEHLSSEDSDTDSMNSQDSQEGVTRVPKYKTTDELYTTMNPPPPLMPRSSSLSRAQIIQHTNQMRNKKSIQLRDEYLKLQRLQQEYKVKKEHTGSRYQQGRNENTSRTPHDVESDPQLMTNGEHKIPLVTTI